MPIKIRKIRSTIHSIEDRLVFIEGELECPIWMLGNKYRYRLATERRELKIKLKRMLDEQRKAYDYN